MNDPKRTSPNYSILVFYICLNLIVPALMIVWAVGRFGPFRHIGWIRGATNIGLFFFIFPVSITIISLILSRI